MTASPATHREHVALGERSHDIEIGAGLLDEAGRFVAACAADSSKGAAHAVIITDANVDQPHARRAAASMADDGTSVDVLVVEPGEQAKSVEMVESLWRGLLEIGADRKTLVVAVGGGVVGDLAGFVAATFARGLGFVQMPTTLLAQVDSSVGGKVGVNLPEAKNIVGAFWQPRGVLIDTTTLATLPEREYRAGLAEVVKYGVILDAQFFAYLEQQAAAIERRDDEVLRRVIARCCRLKADVVERDEREETGLRAALNYGHTFGHAIETLTGYGEYLHGEAVAIGMIRASRLAERLGRVDGAFTTRQINLLQQFQLPVDLPALDVDEMTAAMQRDKKTEQGKLRFVLPRRLGEVELVGDVSVEDVRAVLTR